MDFNTFLYTFKSMVDGAKLTTLVALIVGNLVLGVAVSLKDGTFNLKEIGKFMYTRVLPYIIGYFGVGLVATLDNSWSWAVVGTWGVIDATLVGSILQNLREFGIPIPSLIAGGNVKTKE